MDNPFVKRFVEFIQTPGHSRTISALVILIIAAAVPLTVLVAQQQQQTQQHAAATPAPTINTRCTAGSLPTCSTNNTVLNCTYSPYGYYWTLKTTCTSSQYCSNASCITKPICANVAPGTTCTSTSYCISGNNGTPSGGVGCDGLNTVCCKFATTTAPVTCASKGGTCQNLQCPTGSSPVPGVSCDPTGYQVCCKKNETTPPGDGGGTSPTPIASPSGCQGTLNGQPHTFKTGEQYCVGDSYPGNGITVGTVQCSAPAIQSYKTCQSNGTWGSGICGTGNYCGYTSSTNVSCYASCAPKWICSTNGLACTLAPQNTTYQTYTDQNKCNTDCKAAGSGTTQYYCPSVGMACAIATTGDNVTKYANKTDCESACKVGGGTGTTKYYCQSAGFACKVVDSTTPANATTTTDKTACDNACIGGGGGGGGGGGQCGSLPCCNTTPDNNCVYTESLDGKQCQPVGAPSYACGGGGGGGGIPNCNQSQAYGVGVPDCRQAVCTASPANACGTGSGTQTCKYTLYNGSTNCNPQNVNQTCNANCTGTNVCTNGTCQAQATSSPAPTGSGSPAPTASPAPGDTQLALTVGLDAIGSTGDNVNHDSNASNKNPLTTNRNVEAWIFNTSNNQVADKVGSINYNSATGLFTGTVNLGGGFTTGNYTIKVRSDGHLTRLVSGIQNLTSGQTNQVPRVNLIAGDIYKDNKLNINDYNILLSCVTDPDIANIDDHALCDSDASYITLSDLEDNGVVNKFDYNLFLREYSVQNGD